jgi:hypothetical protein
VEQLSDGRALAACLFVNILPTRILALFPRLNPHALALPNFDLF